MDRDGSWLDVGCANGFLLATFRCGAPSVASRSSRTGSNSFLASAEMARALHQGLAERIWTGSVMHWSPPRRFTYVTALEDQVPPTRLGDLVARLVDVYLEPGGRLIISAYANNDAAPRDLFDELAACGHQPSGRIYIERPGRGPLITAWLDGPRDI